MNAYYLTPLPHSPEQIHPKQIPKQKRCRNRRPQANETLKITSPSNPLEKVHPKQKRSKPQANPKPKALAVIKPQANPTQTPSNPVFSNGKSEISGNPEIGKPQANPKQNLLHPKQTRESSSPPSTRPPTPSKFGTSLGAVRQGCNKIGVDIFSWVSQEAKEQKTGKYIA